MVFFSKEHEVKKHGVGRGVVMPAKRSKGSVGEGETGKKAKATQHTGGQSVSEKSQTTKLVRTSLRNQTEGVVQH